jgi:hypothetical protein
LNNDVGIGFCADHKEGTCEKQAGPYTSPADKLLRNGLVSVPRLSLFLLPVVGGIKQGPIREAAALARQEGLTPVRWKLNTPSFSVYTERVMPSRRPRPGEVVLTKNKYLQDLADYQLLYERGGVVLAEVIR